MEGGCYLFPNGYLRLGEMFISPPYILTRSIKKYQVLSPPTTRLDKCSEKGSVGYVIHEADVIFNGQRKTEEGQTRILSSVRRRCS